MQKFVTESVMGLIYVAMFALVCGAGRLVHGDEWPPVWGFYLAYMLGVVREIGRANAAR